MRFMVIVKATDYSESGAVQTGEDREAMSRYNDELEAAGIVLDVNGLHPSSQGARVHFSGDTRTVIDGPFAETKELVAGYWIWDVKSLDEAIEWAKRCPNPMPVDCEIEIRRVHEAEDFDEAYTPELRAQDDRLRVTLESRRS